MTIKSPWQCLYSFFPCTSSKPNLIAVKSITFSNKATTIKINIIANQTFLWNGSRNASHWIAKPCSLKYTWYLEGKIFSRISFFYLLMFEFNLRYLEINTGRRKSTTWFRRGVMVTSATITSISFFNIWPIMPFHFIPLKVPIEVCLKNDEVKFKYIWKSCQYRANKPLKTYFLFSSKYVSGGFCKSKK